MLKGQMMTRPLLISELLVHADRYHGDTEIVSRAVEGGIHRYTYRDASLRSRQLAAALEKLGVAAGDRVASLAWNGYRHFELYYAVAGSGAVMHTINPRLKPDQVAWIVNHAEDQVLCFDLTFAPLVDAVAKQCPNVKAWVAMTDAEHMPAMQNVEPLCYEELVASCSGDFAWPSFDENSAAGLCYTSGTTGNPKGVLYSHRSTMLHSFAGALPDTFGLSAKDAILPVVPMFHVNAWSLPFIAPMVGAKLVFPGASLDGESLVTLFEAEGVTLSAGVPTVWLGLLQYLQDSGQKLTTLQRMVVGGSACPPALKQAFEDGYGVHMDHAWGMTEMSPLGTYGKLKPKHADLTESERFDLELKQGRPPFGVDLKTVDDQGEELPRDGESAGELLVRGHWVVDRYFKGDDSPLNDGWFPTGDVATLDADGFLQITDRSKDVIKSGGEWISSIELENIAMQHPAVGMAAVVAVPHPKWDERPLLLVVLKPNAAVSPQELLDFYQGKVATWQVPDEAVIVDELPIGATGKVLKNELRKRFVNSSQTAA